MYTETLAYFQYAYETKNFTTAAKMVPMSSQGFGKAMRKLEEELGVELFIQNDKGDRIPTKFADELYIYAKNVKSGYKTLLNSFETIRSKERHDIRVGASLGILGLLGHDFVSGFHEAYPEYHLRVTETSDDVIDRMLRVNRVDIALVVRPYAENQETEDLFSTRVMIWVNAKHPLAQRSMLTVDDLAGENLVMPGREFKVYKEFKSLTDGLGDEAPTFIAESEIFWIYQFAFENKALGFTLDPICKLSMFDNDKVKAIPIEVPKWTAAVAYNEANPLGAPERAFISYCHRYIAETHANETFKYFSL